VRTNVYIDGFNLYYRAVRSTPYKWLDLSKLCAKLLPSHQVNRIRYFTAPAQPLPQDPGVAARQQIYLRALRTIPNLTVHLGQFRPRQRRLPLVTPVRGLPATVEVKYSEEKGTDVNLATYLLIDGFEKDYQQALVISNDSDLALPISLVRQRLGLPIGVVNPNTDPKEPAPAELTAAATFTRRIRTATLAACQFPLTLTDAVGNIHKPPTW
jgi:uncharacterized LabA/DUF88 family protein